MFRCTIERLPMLNTLLGVALLLGFALAAGEAEAAAPAITWHDATELTVEGRGWTDTASYYNRFPARAKAWANATLWSLAGDSAGMAVRFVSDAAEIHARWKLVNSDLAMNHMPATGVSGVDLYVRLNGEWRWLAVGKPIGQENDETLISNLPAGKKEFALYLPLYNGVTSVEVGVPEGSTIESAPPRPKGIKPVVFYGTSITQGGCASRPGMAYPALIGRRLDVATINLGFSGSGRGEHEVSDLLAELDPSVYVIDAMPNMDPGTVDERIRYMLKVIHAKRPDTPLIIVEHAIFTSAYNAAKGPKASESWNRILRQIYKDNAKDWNGRLHYVKCDKLMGSDGEATVDGVHPTDVGFLRMADVLTPAVKKALDN